MIQTYWIISYIKKKCLEKAIAAHSSTLAWRIPWMEEHGRLQSMESLRVRHDWTTSLYWVICRVARQTYTLAVVIEGDTYYSRDVCEPGGGGVSFCPGEWRNHHKRSELKLGCEKQDYVVLPLFQELAYSKYFTYINLFNFPKALQGWYSSISIGNWVIEK